MRDPVRPNFVNPPKKTKQCRSCNYPIEGGVTMDFVIWGKKTALRHAANAWEDKYGYDKNGVAAWLRGLEV